MTTVNTTLGDQWSVEMWAPVPEDRTPEEFIEYLTGLGNNPGRYDEETDRVFLGTLITDEEG